MNDQTLEKLQQLNDTLSSKDSFYLTFNSKKSVFEISFPTPIKLNPNRKYECALQYLSTSNYLINVTDANNKFIYSHDSGLIWNTVVLEKGSYEITQINDEIKRFMINKKHIDAKGNPVISIGVILSTFKSFIDISDTKYKVDFSYRTTII